MRGSTLRWKLGYSGPANSFVFKNLLPFMRYAVKVVP